MENAFTCAYGILNHVRSCIVAPPCTITVTITINDVVVNIACLASDTVLRIAKAKDMAPRKPMEQKIQIIRITGLYSYIIIHRIFVHHKSEQTYCTNYKEVCKK